MSGATANEFKKWSEHASSVGIDSLKYIISDCASARDAMMSYISEAKRFPLETIEDYYD